MKQLRNLPTRGLGHRRDGRPIFFLGPARPEMRQNVRPTDPLSIHGRSSGSTANGPSGTGPHAGTRTSALAPASSSASACTGTPSRTPVSWHGSPLATGRSTSSFTHSGWTLRPGSKWRAPDRSPPAQPRTTSSGASRNLACLIGPRAGCSAHSPTFRFHRRGSAKVGTRLPAVGRCCPPPFLLLPSNAGYVRLPPAAGSCSLATEVAKEAISCQLAQA